MPTNHDVSVSELAGLNNRAILCDSVYWLQTTVKRAVRHQHRVGI